jgi:hypothetical protein
MLDLRSNLLCITLIPSFQYKLIPSPTNLPNAAPILKTGMKIPLGTGIVEVMIEKKN